MHVRWRWASDEFFILAVRPSSDAGSRKSLAADWLDGQDGEAFPIDSISMQHAASGR